MGEDYTTSEAKLSELESKVLFILLKSKEKLSGSKVCRELYGRYHSKGHEVLKNLEKKGLVKKEVRVIDNRTTYLWEVNLEKFFQLLNENNLPHKHRLTIEEIKQLANWFKKCITLPTGLRFEKKIETEYIKSEESYSIFDAIASILHVGVRINDLPPISKNTLWTYCQFAKDKETRKWKKWLELARALKKLKEGHSAIYDKLRYVKIPQPLAKWEDSMMAGVQKFHRVTSRLPKATIRYTQLKPN